MRKIIFILINILLIKTSINCFSQEELKNRWELYNSEQLTGDAKIVKSRLLTNEKNIILEFEIEVAENGNYFLSTWILAGMKDQKPQEFELMVNNAKIASKIGIEGNGWQTSLLKSEKGNLQTINLNEGKNTISFVSNKPEVPEIEFIKLSKKQETATISDVKYRKYISNIEQEIVYRRNNPENKRDSAQLKAVSFSKNYDYRKNLPFSYTTYKTKYFEKNDIQTVSAYSFDGYEFVLELFHRDKPEDYSWVDFSSLVNGTETASISVNIPKDGYYIVRIRAYRQNQSGLAVLYAGGTYYINIPVSGNGFAYYHSSNDELNYFSCKLSGDSRIWLEDVNHKIRAHNDDYSWGDETSSLASRINDEFNMTISALLVSSYGSYNPTGNCDLYMACLNANERKYGIWPFRKTICDYFPDLDEDDAIEAQVPSDQYNCASWAGGIERGWFWGTLTDGYGGGYLGLPFGSPYVWSTWDGYFSNDPYLRYIGADYYTTTGATSTNADIAVWSTNGTISQVTHFSARNDANQHAHGYEWESKPGQLARVFHPRDDMESDTYGSIFDYYIKDTNKKSASKKLTFSESVELGLTVVEEIALSDKKKNTLKSMKNNSSDSIINILFNNWLESHLSDEIIIQSNPISYIKTQEGLELISYCKDHDDLAFSFLSEKVFSGTLSEFQENITSLLICGLSNSKYSKKMEDTKENWKENCFTASGEYIAPLPTTITKRYIIRVLDELDADSELLSEAALDFGNNGVEDFNVYPNPIRENSTINVQIKEVSKISLNIYDINGSLKKTIIDSKSLESGTYSFNLINYDLTSGIYFCKLNINNSIYTRKIVVL